MPHTADIHEAPRQSASTRHRRAPHWMAWVPTVAILWPAGFGSLQTWWAVHGPPSFGPQHFDLIYFSGWNAVGLCAAAALTAMALRFARWNWALSVAAWGVCAAHLIASPLLLLDFVSAVLPGLGVPFSAAGFLSRAACLFQGVLVGAAAVAWRRQQRNACLYCGRSSDVQRPDSPPQWAWWAAYGAVFGCMLRLGAQFFLAFGDLARHLSGTRLIVEALLFEAGFLLAGVILPLALVHRWGRATPPWIPLVGARPMPRWLLLGPAFALSPLMTAYFTITLVKLDGDTLRGTQSFDSFQPAFLWVAVPGYLIWGIGLGVAAIFYQRITRPTCSTCGR